MIFRTTNNKMAMYKNKKIFIFSSVLIFGALIIFSCVDDKGRGKADNRTIDPKRVADTVLQKLKNFKGVSLEEYSKWFAPVEELRLISLDISRVTEEDLRMHLSAISRIDREETTKRDFDYLHKKLVQEEIISSLNQMVLYDFTWVSNINTLFVGKMYLEDSWRKKYQPNSCFLYTLKIEFYYDGDSYYLNRIYELDEVE